ncbi:MAG: 1-acyl-sn-glycerol-3-phosphate acyltransferase, partial [Coriobacteriaceae bacterium]|nr:1-acyl-sn-glycerol-3-phosphate acyltransferase [Coriobacteriaceae bacterium]
DLVAIRRAARMLNNCEAVGMFPEGTRRGKGSQEPDLHAGAALIARMGKAPILPMTVRNAEHIKQKGKFLRFPQVTIEYGCPVLLEDFDFLPKEDRLGACSWYAMRECFALSFLCPPEEVAMRELFPQAKDYTAVFEKHAVPRHTTEELVGLDGEGDVAPSDAEASPVEASPAKKRPPALRPSDLPDPLSSGEGLS